MQTLFLFILLDGDNKSMRLSEAVVAWVGQYIKLINAAGIKIYIEGVHVDDAKKPTVQKKLKEKYGFTKFPALYFPPDENNPPMTYADWYVIRKQLEPLVQLGRDNEAQKVNEIVAQPSSFEQYLHSDLNFESYNEKGAQEQDEGELNSTSIQKAMSQFNSRRPNKGRPISEKGAMDSDTTSMPARQNGRPDNIEPQPLPPASTTRKSSSSSPVAAANNDSTDDAIMNAFMMNNIGTGDTGIDFT